MSEKQAVLTEQTPTKIEVITIPKCYLRDQQIARRSAYHTAYCGSTPSPISDPTVPHVLLTLTFWRGVAYNVPLNVYERFADAGIATTDRPRRRFGDDDDD
jgi:hypothetical protein